MGRLKEALKGPERGLLPPVRDSPAQEGERGLICSKKLDLLNSLLRDDVFNDVTMDVGEAEVATLETVG